MDSNTWIMILRMSAAVAAYILLTVVSWKIWQKRKHTLGMKILIGLLYGAASVVSNHIGVDYGILVMNVRDIGPMAAGLFFSPLAGIISGLIGGIERYVIAEIWGIGNYTKVACSISTAMAGVLAAVMHRWIFHGKRPSSVQAFLLGAVMEVFHMYSIMITNRNSYMIATMIIRVCAVPMISFCAIGLMGCSLVIRVMDEGAKKVFRRRGLEEIPLDHVFQKWLLVVTMVIFSINFFATSHISGQRAMEEASLEASVTIYSFLQRYPESKDDKSMLKTLLDTSFSIEKYSYLLVNNQREAVEGSMDFSSPLPVLTEEEYQTARQNLSEGFFSTQMASTDLERNLCMVEQIDNDHILILFRLESDIMSARDSQMYETTFSDILLFSVLYVLVTLLVERLIVDNLHSVNRSLTRITGGELNEEVNVRNTREFVELSDDINKMVDALKGYIQAAEKRMEQELKFAKSIQEASLPRIFKFPRNDFEIYALMNPAKEVGGDFYDFFFINNDMMVLVIADVSGKGVPAALFMMRAKTAIKNMARSGHSPASLLENVNNTLCEGNDAEMFVTVWIGIIDLSTGRMRCANAGHEFPVLKRAGEDWKLLRDKHGMALAAMENMPMREYEIQMNPGDRLFVYTDGVPEAINARQEAYGTDRLVAALNRVSDVSQEVTLQGVRRDLSNFVQAADQFDDITMLGFTYFGQEKSTV